MSKPTQEEFEVAIRVLEWAEQDMLENEPHAVSTIEDFTTVRMNLGDMSNE